MLGIAQVEAPNSGALALFKPQFRGHYNPNFGGIG